MSHTLLDIFQRKLDYDYILLTRVHKSCDPPNIDNPKSADIDLDKMMGITNNVGNFSFAVCDIRYWL